MLASCSQEIAEGQGQDAPAQRTLELSAVVARDDAGAAARLEVEIVNNTAGPICLGRNYAASTRVSARANGADLPSPNAFEGRPAPGCLEVASGDGLTASYDLRELYAPRTDFEDVTVCYEVSWREGGQSEALLDRSARTCSEAGRRQ